MLSLTEYMFPETLSQNLIYNWITMGKEYPWLSIGNLYVTLTQVSDSHRNGHKL